MTEQSTVIADRETRLMEMGGGFIAIRDGYVNLEDMISARRPGAIIRCRADPRECISVFHGPEAPVGCVAGWVSEEE